ncbi:MAG: EAL domain-containing protein [Actinomycetota bacterium]
MATFVVGAVAADPICDAGLNDVQPSDDHLLMTAVRSRWAHERHLIVAVSDLLHETQKERGASSVFLSSDGAMFADELAGIRELTDAARASFLELDAAGDVRCGDDYAVAHELLGELGAMRAGIDDGHSTAASAIEYFNDLNQALLVSIGNLIQHAPTTLIRTRLVGLLALMRAKELMGMERAVMARVIGEDRFATTVNLWVVSLVSAQESLLRIFDQSTSEDLQGELTRIQAHPAVQRTTRMETDVLVNGVGDFRMDSREWFLAMTQRIDLLQDIEQQIFDELAALDPDSDDADDAVDEALDLAVDAMREIRGLVDAVRNGESSLRELIRGRQAALDTAGKQLAAAQKTAQEMAALAISDALTGLPNRALTDNLISDALERSEGLHSSVAVMTIDLDHFKIINDSLGHAVGDALLRHLASRLRRAMRSCDTVARVGGDEFLVIAEPVASTEEATALAHEILAIGNDPFTIGGRQLQISLSIGVAVADGPTTPAELIGESDMAAYRAKALGRGRVERFDEELRRRIISRHETGQGLRLGLERGEIMPWFQPIIDLETGYPIALEALARWHTADGVRPAGAWIEAAEDEGLMPTLSERILQQALRDRLTIGTALPAISVNVVAANLVAPGFAAMVEDLLDECRVDPGDLWIEITEQTAVADQRAVDTLHRLRRLGCTIALDDFGSGFSALSVLRELPIDVVKLDRAFVGGLAEDRQTRTIIESVLRILGTLGLRSVAEGVEDPAELDVLRSLGCDMAQGYAIGRPAPDATTWHFDVLDRLADTANFD